MLMWPPLYLEEVKVHEFIHASQHMHIDHDARAAGRRHHIVFLIVLTVACDAPVRDPAPVPTPPADTAAPASDEAAVSTATIIYMEATPAEIDERRTTYVDEQDYYVMTDDLMWYRAEARALLETQEFAEFVSREKGPLSFSINGQVRRYDFEDVLLLDFIVAYRPGAEPLILAPVDVHEIAEFFRTR